jgi:hypothetical protein
VEHQPVARDLGEDGHEDQHDHAAAAVQAAQDRQAAPEPLAPAACQLSQAGDEQHRRSDEHDRQPPRQAERTHERERRQCREDALDREDRHLCGDQRRHARGFGRSRAPQRADARRRADLAVELAAEIPHACGPEQATASDRAAGGHDADVPRLGPDDEREELERGGGQQYDDRRRLKRGGELLPAIRDHVRQDARHDDGTGNGGHHVPALHSRHDASPTPT